MIVIEGRSVGARKPLFAEWSIPLPPDLGDGGKPVTLRDLISRLVRAELEAYRTRREARRLPRVLGSAEIADGVARGRVDPGGREVRAEGDEETAVGWALQAFEDGLYLVVIDGVEQRRLDGEVFLRPDSRVAFVRLVHLAGA